MLERLAAFSSSYQSQEEMGIWVQSALQEPALPSNSPAGCQLCSLLPCGAPEPVELRGLGSCRKTDLQEGDEGISNVLLSCFFLSYLSVATSEVLYLVWMSNPWVVVGRTTLRAKDLALTG